MRSLICSLEKSFIVRNHFWSVQTAFGQEMSFPALVRDRTTNRSESGTELYLVDGGS